MRPAYSIRGLEPARISSIFFKKKNWRDGPKIYVHFRLPGLNQLIFFLIFGLVGWAKLDSQTGVRIQMGWPRVAGRTCWGLAHVRMEAGVGPVQLNPCQFEAVHQASSLDLAEFASLD